MYKWAFTLRTGEFFILRSSLFTFLIFSQHHYLLHERRNGVYALAVSGEVVEGEVYVEEVFPFMPDVWQRLDLGEIDVVETQDGEHLGERSLIVSQTEDDARLVGLFDGTEQGCLLRIADHEKPGVVVRIVVDAFLQHLHAVHVGGVRRADGCPSPHLVLGDVGCRACGIFCLHRLEVGMVGQELAALHEGYRMGVNLLQGAPVVFWQTADAVLYVELVLAYHGGSALPEQFVIVEQTARNGVFNGADAYHGRVALDIFEHLFEGSTTDDFYLFALEILVGGNVVERSQLSLNCYSLHVSFILSIPNGCISGCFFLILFFLSLLQRISCFFSGFFLRKTVLLNKSGTVSMISRI